MNLHRYGLLASAIAGRQMGVVESGSGETYTDGQVIYLARGAEKLQLVGLVAQAALLCFGSFEQTLIVQLTRKRSAVASRYLTLEAVRVAHVGQYLMPRAVQAVIAAQWSGAVSGSPAESLRRAMEEKSIPALPELFGVIRPWVLLKGLREIESEALSDAELRGAQKYEPEFNEEKDEEEEESETSILLNKMAGPAPSDNAISNMFKAIFGVENKASGEEKKGQGGSGAELPSGGAKFSKKISAGAKLIRTVFGIGEPDRPDSDNGVTYPEWDYRTGAYLPQWCYVTEFDVAPSAGARGLAGVSDRALRRKLARLGTTHQRHKRQHEGESLDIDALIELAGDVLSGQSGDERIYETTRKTGRGLAVVVLIDASGSTSDQQAGGSPIWEAQRKLAQNVITAFDELGDMVGAYGFRSYGRNDVRFLRVKDFDKRFDQAAQTRLQALKPSGFTRLGAAIRHASDLLTTKAATGHHLLVVVSDGFPYDIEYEEEYAEQDVRHALGEAMASGVGCVCISVGAPTDKALLDRVWGNVGHASLNEPREIVRYAEPLFRAAIKNAAAEYR